MKSEKFLSMVPSSSRFCRDEEREKLDLRLRDRVSVKIRARVLSGL